MAEEQTIQSASTGTQPQTGGPDPAANIVSPNEEVVPEWLQKAKLVASGVGEGNVPDNSAPTTETVVTQTPEVQPVIVEQKSAEIKEPEMKIAEENGFTKQKNIAELTNSEDLPSWLVNVSKPEPNAEQNQQSSEKEQLAENVPGAQPVSAQVTPAVKKKADVFNAAKDFFMVSLGRVQDVLKKSRTAGVKSTDSSKEATAEKKQEELKQVESAVANTPTATISAETLEEKKKLIEAETIYQNGLATIRDLISPSSMEIRYDSLRVEGMYTQSFYVYAYPRYLDANWLSPVVNFDVTMDIAQFVYPIDSAKIMKVLRKKVAQMESSVRIMTQKGMVSDPALETALQDAEELRLQIQRGQEKLFQFALYFTVYSEDDKKLTKIAKQLESMLGGKLILVKRADLQQEHAFNSCLPLCLDEIEVNLNMNTSPLSSTFPFSSADLTSNEGILYGLNRHNDSLIIFDRFTLENANSVVFAKSGAGKSYAVKLEILRSMMLGTDVIVIDPENEYEALCQTVGGAYLRVSLTSDRRINPFDLPAPLEGEDLQPGDLLRSNIINLHGLLKIMLGGVNPEEEGILDKALIDVYALKGITMEITDPSQFVPPTMEDLYDILSTMEGGQSLAQRLQKFTVGTYSGIFNKPTNVDLKSGLMVFCIRDLEDALRPIAMYIILNYIWNRIRSQLKKRILVVDEAWTMMQYEDSAKFMFSLVKRARKYYLGITTITQDVEDFVKSTYGRPVITNSSMQLLMKQAPAAVDVLAKVFDLTEGEKYMLLNSGVGQGLFFAGMKHVAIQVIASYTEDKIITTNPEEILKGREGEITYT